jgi:uncharacterized protein (DUF1684 family)
VRDTLELADYRRRVADLYAEVRRSPDPADAWAQWRVGRDVLFSTHTQSPVPESDRPLFDGSPFFDYEPEWRVVANVEPVDEDFALIDHSGEGATRFAKAGVAHAVVGGEAIGLDLYWLDSYGGGLFLPFRDGTSGNQTYGGGRYLLDGAKGADLGTEDGRLVLDFNFAYHPSCVWDDRWSCPLAPPGNRIAVEVLAGERLR